jgi:pescadillo protein
MMSKKTKRLYSRMQHGIQKKSDHVQKLVEKREQIEQGRDKTQQANKKAKK